jgi:hypothetical protein
MDAGTWKIFRRVFKLGALFRLHGYGLIMVTGYGFMAKLKLMEMASSLSMEP